MTDPAQAKKRIQQLKRAALLQIALNFGAFMIASFVLNLIFPNSAEINLLIACVLGYAPEWYALHKSQSPIITAENIMRWFGGVAIYAITILMLRHYFPSEIWAINKLLYTGIASLLGFAGEVGGAWIGLRIQLLKKRQK